jgi:hypothetical protein
VTLQKIAIGQKVNDLLHLIFTSHLKEIKKTSNILLNGSQGGHKNAYCDIETRMDHKGDIKMPIVILRQEWITRGT